MAEHLRPEVVQNVLVRHFLELTVASQVFPDDAEVLLGIEEPGLVGGHAFLNEFDAFFTFRVLEEDRNVGNFEEDVVAEHLVGTRVIGQAQLDGNAGVFVDGLNAVKDLTQGKEGSGIKDLHRTF